MTRKMKELDSILIFQLDRIYRIYRILFCSAESGLYGVTFVRKVIRTKKNPVHLVDPV
jgi:hypothetical protein